MKSKFIRVCCTSFLPPSLSGWGALKKFGELKFGEYGDWPNVLLSSSLDPVIWVLFLEDLIRHEEVGENKEIDSLISHIISPLETRLSSIGAPVVVAWSHWRPDSVIRSAKNLPAWSRLKGQMENKLFDLASQYDALYLVDLDAVFAESGFQVSFDARNFYAARCRLSSAGINSLALATAKIFERLYAPVKKVIALDCDNTIWGGVVGEVGVNSITVGTDGIGKAFQDFQTAVLRLSQQGILIVLLSKNNEQEVWDAFEGNSQMKLQKSDIISWRINWSEKAENITQIAKELDLGVDSFIFWDDNPLEREKMRLMRPEVLTPEVPVDVSEWPNFLHKLDALASFKVTKEDLQKNEQYHSRSAFIRERSKVTNESEFFRSISMQPSPVSLDIQSLGRAEQLCAKTNQYNLRTIRHSNADLHSISQDDMSIAFLAKLTDRFGDHGIVGLVIARLHGNIAFLDTFLMSCRVLGRHFDAWMLSELINQLKARGIRWLLAEFRPSGRNIVAKDFLSENGFDRFDSNSDPSGGSAGDLMVEMMCNGEVYLADLDTIKVPHLEIFSS